ncbi:iron-sulfur protein [Geosporobacter ferrireducens]|uniref:Ferredoxin n=1 Tax=Geosporobacter ferrireducens TaxID=1424294 RepID=A0A1D8GNG5_9FIRM|nr:DUF362 domain-containing protein [Geosporobacter ferrireducens]AOT72402.1 iron-sulfur protein [Geosporobacter ferrireducens]MTI56341.1 DUF362 domain-containing protein [Geosporobacter ferrireducens]
MEKVALISCSTYEIEFVRKAIRDAFVQLGGVEQYIQPGDKVLLKANLLMKKNPEEAATTHPAIVQALAEILVQHGATVIIGDSPGGPFSEKHLKGVYKVCGMEEAAKASGAVLNYDISHIEVKGENLKLLKNLTVINVLEEVDKVISVSKLKTHGMALYTGAVKNMFGVIPGLLKAEYHFKMPEIKDFSDALLDICQYANPILSFMDGIVGMEGDGPSAGIPREIGVVLASPSPYHLDVVGAALIGLTPSEVPTIARSIERNICRGTLADIEILGTSIEAFIKRDFKVPSIRSVSFLKGKMPKLIERPINRLLQPKPVFLHDLCIGCRDCEESCPPKIIKMEKNRPVADLNHCIRCFCCQELCPKKAVQIHRPWLLDKIVKW